MKGFSAGEQVAGWVDYKHQDKNFIQPGAVDLLKASLAFQVLIYPGPRAVRDSVSSSALPAFVLAANDTGCWLDPIAKLLKYHRNTK